MRWTPGDRSNIEDRRGMSGVGVGGLGIGGLVLLLLLSWFTGVDLISLFSGAGGSTPTESVGTAGKVTASPEEERLVDMVDAVMDDAQETWSQILAGRYQQTTAVLFRDAIQSACGFAQSATGPFYCPADRKVYLDLGFFGELHRNLGAPGDFAQAYVLAHELGHHVQTILGVESQVRRRQAADASERNALSVRMELQADCFAGVWGFHANKAPGGVDLDPGDVDEGLRAAASIGDDRLQRMQGGRIAPERFTHGTSEQRAQWLRRGLETGDPNNCDTFSR
jgi:predicted metalloprotease